MKRSRVSVHSKLHEATREVELDPFLAGRALIDLPWDVFVIIFLKIPVKGILACRCTCKSWCERFSNPRLVTLHSINAPFHLMLRTNDPKRVSRTLYMVELKHEAFDLGDCFKTRNLDPDHLSYCQSHVKIELGTKFQLPLRNADSLLNNEGGVNPNVASEKKGYLTMNKPKNHKFGLVNSCEGLLCLCEAPHNDPVIVCNPITGEYIKLPEAEKVESSKDLIVSGVGFSPTSNQYKVLRMRKEQVEIHTVGTGSWRNIEATPYLLCYDMRFPTYLHGCLHWIHPSSIFSSQNSSFILSFDLERERFKPFSSPPCHTHYGLFGLSYGELKLVSMGRLRGNLSVCDSSQWRTIRIWEMKDYGVEKSWTKLLKIDTRGESYRWPFRGMFHTVKYMDRGSILLYHDHSSSLIYYHKKGQGDRQINMVGIGVRCKTQAFVHVPTLIPLKDIIKGDHVEVLNVDPRCGKLKLQEEKKAVSLVEDNDTFYEDEILD